MTAICAAAETSSPYRLPAAPGSGRVVGPRSWGQAIESFSPRGVGTLACGLDAVLASQGAIRLCPEAIQSGFGALLSGCVTTSGCTLKGSDQVRTISRAQVTITRRPISIDLGASPIKSRVLERGEPRRLITLLRREVTGTGRAVTMVRCHIPSNRSVKDLANGAVPLRAVAVSIVRDGVSLIGGTVPKVSSCVPLVCQTVPLDSQRVPLARCPRSLTQLALPVIYSRLALIIPDLDRAASDCNLAGAHARPASPTVLRPA